MLVDRRWFINRVRRPVFPISIPISISIPCQPPSIRNRHHDTGVCGIVRVRDWCFRRHRRRHAIVEKIVALARGRVLRLLGPGTAAVMTVSEAGDVAT